MNKCDDLIFDEAKISMSNFKDENITSKIVNKKIEEFKNIPSILINLNLASESDKEQKDLEINKSFDLCNLNENLDNDNDIFNKQNQKIDPTSNKTNHEKVNLSLLDDDNLNIDNNQSIDE